MSTKREKGEGGDSAHSSGRRRRERALLSRTLASSRPIRCHCFDCQYELLKSKKCHTSTALIIPPQSDETAFCKEFASFVDTLQLDYTHYAFVPEYLGHHRATDLAARAVLTAWRSHGDALALPLAYSQYVDALEAVKVSIDLSDATLMAIMLLALTERFLNVGSTGYALHWKAAADIIRARPIDQVPSELTRCIVYLRGYVTVQKHVHEGDASPFEEDRWLQLLPSNRTTTIPVAIANFTQTAYQTSIRYTRLVSDVRKLGTQNLRNPEVLQSALHVIELARQLLAMEDEDGETEILHRVKIQPTVHAADKNIVSISYDFRTSFDFEAAMSYWEVRLSIIAVCLRLLDMTADTELETFAAFSLDRRTFQADQVRLMTNVFMSVQYACNRGVFTKIRMPSAFVACWAALKRLKDFRGKSVDLVRPWLLQRTAEIDGTWWALSNHVMDNTQWSPDLLTGTPLHHSSLDRGVAGFEYLSERISGGATAVDEEAHG